MAATFHHRKVGLDSCLDESVIKLRRLAWRDYIVGGAVEDGHRRV